MNSVLAIIFVLGLLIFFHELGHFLVARWFKIGVEIFSLGFGPKLLGFVYAKTEYRLSAIPLGGYVKLVGEGKNAVIQPPFTETESFSLRPAWQRLGVVLAGPVFNFILAWLIFWGLFYLKGKIILLPTVGQVVAHSPAEQAGLKPGDVILKVNNTQVNTWEELAKAIQTNKSRYLTLQVKRHNQVLRVKIEPELKKVKNIFGETVIKPQIGIIAGNNFITQQLGFFEAAKEGLFYTGQLIRLTWEGIVKLIERVIPLKTIGGPISIAQMVSSQAKAGWVSLFNLIAVLSINLGLLNLLPIPVLDGGHILFYTLEIITGKPLNEKAQEISTKIGLALLAGLMLLAIYNDLTKILH